MHDHPDRETAPVEDTLPSQGVRTIITFLLFVHLFSLGVALTLSSSSAPFAQKLRRIPGMYLQLLYMDLEFDSGTRFGPPGPMSDDVTNMPKARRGMYHLTRGEQYDVGYFIEFQYERDGKKETARLPEMGTWPGERFRRDLTLAWEAGRLVGEDPGESMLPEALGRHFLTAYNIPDGQRCTLVIRRLTLRSDEDAVSSDPARSNPWDESKFQEAYKALVWRDNGKTRLIKPSSAMESSPSVNK